MDKGMFRFLLIILLLIPTVSWAKMQTFLKSPRFDGNGSIIITTPIAVVNGFTIVRVENVETGCVIIMVRETGSITSTNGRCG